MSQTQSKRIEEIRERVERVIKGFLSKDHYDGLFETRIQKLIFYSEVYTIVHYRRRVTEAVYRPYMYGAYSENVSDILSTMDGVKRNRIIRHGNRTIQYSIKGPISNDDSTSKIIDKVHKETKFTDTSDLAQFSKDSYLFENTKYDHEMQFEEFAEALDAHPDIEKEHKQILPEKVDSVDPEDLVEVTD